MKLFLLATGVFLIFASCSKSGSSTPQAAPTIAAFAPKKDTAGGQVTITGTNFSTVNADNIVKFNGITGTVLSSSSTQIIVSVPNGILSAGPISVSVLGQSAATASNFIVLSRNEMLVLGNWHYALAIRNDTLTQNGNVAYAISGIYSNPSPATDYLNFTDSGVAYSFQSAWGIGQSGGHYRDTINYAVVNNNILFSYPAGTNNLGNPFNYSSYYDTLSVRSLTTSSFALSRVHHFKHYTFNTGEKKQSIDSLIR